MAAAQSELSEIDRELLLEKLKAIQESSNKTVQGRYSVAVSALRSAVESDSTALDLYIKCYEKVNFTDQARKSQDFREWKRRNKDRHDEPGFKRALRHQIAWLLTTIEVAGDPKKREKMSEKAIATLDAIFKDAETLDGHQGILGQPALGSVFARAYDLDKTVKIQEWPKGPLAIESMYEMIIMKPLRTKETLTKLKAAWTSRIKHEGLVHQVWGREGAVGKDRVPAFEQWMAQGRINLLWQMETDLYAAGDEKGAALRMLDHLEKYLSHSSAPQWIIEFTNLINGLPARGAEDEDS
jgi:hypothetical protein